MKNNIIRLVVVSAFLPMLAFAQSVTDTVSDQIDCAVITHALKLGSRDAGTGGDVTTLQIYLSQANYLDVDPTGYFGKATKKAVQDFQSANGITPLGSVGPYTRTKIKEISCTGSNTNTTSVNTTNTQPVVTTSSVTTPAISATVNSAAFNTNLPVITGMASGLSGIRLSVKIGKNIVYSSSRIEVTGNGTWSHQVTKAIPAGAYRVIITSADPRVSEDVVMVEGQINITGNYTVDNQVVPVISATVDSSAFDSSMPTLTGTASGLSGVRLSLNIGKNVQYTSPRIEVSGNGTWSHQVTKAIPAGAYRAVITSADPKVSEDVVVAEGLINITGNTVVQCPTYESKPVISSITPSSGPVGTTIEIKGCNFLGFESDKVLWFKNSKGETGILNGTIDEATRTSNTVMKVTIPKTLCRTMNWYSGLDCSLLELVPDTYTIYSQSYGGSSNVMNFTVTAK